MTHKYLRSKYHTPLAWQLSIGALLCSGFLAGLAQWVGAEPLLIGEVANDLIAQDVVQGLPPPPGQAALPSQPDLPDRSPAPPQEQQTSDRRYIVVVNGGSSRLLSQVQRVASSASVQEYQGQRVIQVATFDDSDRAERQVQLLASRGIGAKILPVSNTGLPDSQPSPSLAQPLAQSSVQARSPQIAASPDLPPPDFLPLQASPSQALPSQAVPREVNFNGGQPTLNQFPSPPPLPAGASRNSDGSRPSEDVTNSAARSSQPDALRSGSSDGFTGSDRLNRGRAYFVVIPGKQGELDAISNQVIRLGDGFGIAQLVQQTSEPRGPHVQVGPFGDRNAANRWNRYFRDFGMDARIYVR